MAVVDRPKKNSRAGADAEPKQPEKTIREDQEYSPEIQRKLAALLLLLAMCFCGAAYLLRGETETDNYKRPVKSNYKPKHKSCIPYDDSCPSILAAIINQTYLSHGVINTTDWRQEDTDVPCIAGGVSQLSAVSYTCFLQLRNTTEWNEVPCGKTHNDDLTDDDYLTEAGSCIKKFGPVGYDNFALPTDNEPKLSLTEEVTGYCLGEYTYNDLELIFAIPAAILLLCAALTCYQAGMPNIPGMLHELRQKLDSADEKVKDSVSKIKDYVSKIGLLSTINLWSTTKGKGEPLLPTKAHQVLTQ